MKVVRVISRLNVGGPARHVVLLDTGLRRRGYETLLVHGSLSPGEASLESLAADASLPTRSLPELGRRISPLSDVRALATLIRIVFREKPDIVHTHTAKAGALGRIAAAVYNTGRPRAERCAVVHTFHGHVLSGYFSHVGSMLARTAERALAVVTDRVIVISPGQRRDIVERFHVASEAQTSTIPLGLDLAPLFALGGRDRSLRRALGIADDEIVVGYAGRFVPIKDLPTLVRAFSVALAVAPRMHLLLAGDGPQKPAVEALVAELGLQGRVHLLGWVNDLARFYDGVDVCANSSINEGTPVALIEAMAAGKPVAATAVGGVPDVVEDGVTGILVPSRDAAALGDALAALASDPDVQQTMGVAGRAAAGRFAHERLVADIDALYAAELAARRAAARPTVRV